MRQKAEEIYHRFVNYEWNDVGEGLKISILEAIETALKEGQKLPIHSVSQQSKQFICRDCEKPSKEYRDQLCEPCHKWYTDS